MWRGDVIVDDRRQMHGDIILGHAHLLGHLAKLDLDIDVNQPLGERIDLDETGVDGTVEASKLGDQTDIALGNGLVGVRADEAARNRAEDPDAVAQSVDEGSVDSVAGIVLANA